MFALFVHGTKAAHSVHVSISYIKNNKTKLTLSVETRLVQFLIIKGWTSNDYELANVTLQAQASVTESADVMIQKLPYCSSRRSRGRGWENSKIFLVCKES